MNSLWLSLTGSTEHLAIHGTARRYLEGWLTPHRVRDAVTVITRLVHHVQNADHRGELILSHHDDTLLIEVVTHRPAAGKPADEPPLGTQPAPVHNWGAHPTSTGVVIWAEMRLDGT
jgi:hypothetical protein